MGEAKRRADRQRGRQKMTDVDRPQIEAYCIETKPTFWQRLGFGQKMANFTPEEEARTDLPGWFRTNLRVRLAWSDAFRVLISRKLFISVVTKTDTIVSTAVTKAETSVLAP